MRLRALILGAAAGGGFPQWNCSCVNCAAVRRGDDGLVVRTQSSLAVSGDGDTYALINASPDLGAQLLRTPALHPRDPARFGLRDSPIRSVLLTNGDIDHVAGLLTLREKQPFTLYMTAEIAGVIAGNSIFNALDPALVRREIVSLDRPFDLLDGVRATLFAVPGKVPLYLEGESVRTDLEGEQTVGVEFAGREGARFFYVPGCAKLTDELAARISGAPLVLFDGTVFTDDEMREAGVGTKTGRRMGHMPMSGADGSLAALAPLGIARKVYVHINNTNPALQARSRQRAEVEAAGWEIAFDGMELTL